MKIYLLFNKQTHALISATDSIVNFPKDVFLIKEIETDDYDGEPNSFNLARYRWEGTFETGRLVDLFEEKKAVVTEQEVDAKYYGLFFRKYRIEYVLFNLLLFTKTDNSICDEMKDFLSKLMEKKQKEIEFYKTSPNHIYETVEMQNERFDKSFKV